MAPGVRLGSESQLAAGKLSHGGAIPPLEKLRPIHVPSQPPYSPDIDKWLKNKGEAYVDSKGTWVYKDWEENVVAYPGGYPDFKIAGLVKCEAPVKQVPDYKLDYQEANRQYGREYDSDIDRWHHHEDGKRMQLISKELHARFGHEGGVAAGRRRSGGG